MFYTLTRTVTAVERWHNIEASSQEEAEVLLEAGKITRPPDKEDTFDELIDAEETQHHPSYSLVGEFTAHERTQIARLFSCSIPAHEHELWTLTNGHGPLCACAPAFGGAKTPYCAVERGGHLAFYAPTVRQLVLHLKHLYTGRGRGEEQDADGNNHCTSHLHI